MAEESTRQEVERELEAKKDSIQRRIDDIEDEIVTLPAAIKAAIAKHPVVGIAGAVAAGLAIGFLFTRRKKTGTKTPPFHQRLVEQYIDAVGDDVRRRVRKGRSPEQAVRESLEDRAPLIIYAPRQVQQEERESRGFFYRAGDIALKTALGFAVKTVVDVLTASLNVKELQKMLDLEEEERRTAEAAHAGDGAAERIDGPADLEGPGPAA